MIENKKRTDDELDQLGETNKYTELNLGSDSDEEDLVIIDQDKQINPIITNDPKNV